MDLISKQDLTRLLDGHHSGPHVSIFLPTVRAGAETQQNPIRFKNLLREAAGRLAERGLDKSQVDALLEPARELVDDYDFWQHQEDGLAVFVAPGAFHTYRLPLAFQELAAVEDRFHLKSLFPLFNVEGSFFILALSQKKVRLLEGDRYRVWEVKLDDVPQSLADALGTELTEPSIQVHSASPAAQRGGGVFHGQGAGEEDTKGEIRKFFHLLDGALREFLGKGEAPLVLAGVDYLLPIYREASDYPHLADEGLPGNPDDLSARELHERAWTVVKPILVARRQKAAERFGDLSSHGRSSADLTAVVPAAVDGRVDTLFVPRGVRRWGGFDGEARQVEIHGEQTTGSEDLLDLAAVHTFLNSGTVYAVDPAEIPGQGEVAAVFRY
jgi:hypothetical protein